MKGREARRVRRFPYGRRWPSIGAAPLTGRERKGSVGEGRWRKKAALTSGASGAARERRERAAAWALRATVPRWAALVGWLGDEGGRADARAGGKLGHAGCGPARWCGAGRQDRPPVGASAGKKIGKAGLKKRRR